MNAHGFLFIILKPSLDQTLCISQIAVKKQKFISIHLWNKARQYIHYNLYFIPNQGIVELYTN